METQSNTWDFLGDGSQRVGGGTRGGNILDGSYVDSVGGGISSGVWGMDGKVMTSVSVEGLRTGLVGRQV